ncbi:MAG: hypothetical protein AABZ47_18235, partial [Planctomycetota bacterium]
PIRGNVWDASHPVRQLAIRICDKFVDLLAEKNIVIPSKDRTGDAEEACFYGPEYYALEDAVVGILVEELVSGAAGRRAGRSAMKRGKRSR